MKTIEIVNSEIENLRSEIEKIKVDLQEPKMLPKLRRSLMTRYKNLLKQIKLMRQCVMYLKSQPDEEFLKKEKDRLTARLRLIDTQFEAQYSSLQESARKAKKKEVYKTMDVAGTKAHLKNIQFLLSR